MEETGLKNLATVLNITNIQVKSLNPLKKLI